MRRPIPVSAVVMTRNEGANVPKCLRSLEGFGEVFVVDSASTDGTQAIAEEHGAKVVAFDWDGRYPKKKQWCLENLPFAHDWVLYLDADEELSPELREEIAALFAGGAPPAHGYFAAFDYVVLGRRLRYGHRVHKLLLFDRRRGRFPQHDDLDLEGQLMEVEMHFQPRVDGTTARLRHRALHDDHDRLAHWFDRHNAYSTWEAAMRERGQLPDPHESQPPGRKALKRAFAAMPLKPLVAFLHSYLLRAGFLDGRAGLHFALARAFYYWQIGAKRREFRKRAA